MAAILRRDLILAVRIGGGMGLAVGFFLLVSIAMPFGVGAEPGLLARLAPAAVWIGAVLAVLLSLDRLFQADVEDGSLDQLRLAPVPLEAAVLSKCAAHWLTTGLPLVLAAPLVAVMFNMPSEYLGPLLASLVIGTPGLTLVGAIGAALTAGLRRGGLLISLLTLPLYVPALIFGTGAAMSDTATPFLFLGALSLFALALGPFATAAALRLTLD
ncbi:MAG: heme exporter protein CcmB [Alphaproteobacteria bacterium]